MIYRTAPFSITSNDP